MKKITVMRDGRPATAEELNCAVEGKPLPPLTGSVFVGVEIFVFRHSDLFPQDPWQVWSGPFPGWCEANAWIAKQQGWPGPMRAGRKAIVWETPNAGGQR